MKNLIVILIFAASWAGATPREHANTLEMTPEVIADLYPDGMQALPPELEGR